MHDWNLIRVLATIDRTRSVTGAARALGMSQSAVSHALGRLREALGDPLYVRVARGVTPTPFAAAIADDVRALEARADALFRRRAPFDPTRATGRITIATTDYFDVVAAPRLLTTLAREAPGVTLSIRPTGDALPSEALEAGWVDLAIAGFYRDLPDGYYSAHLFDDPLRSAVGSNRPVPADPAAFLAARHALVTLRGDFADGLADALGAPRTFAYGTYSFTAIAFAVAEADLCVTAPSRLLDRLAAQFPLTLFDPPVPVEPIRVRMVWHGRTHADPLHAWFRDQVRAAVSR
ncbi:MAG: LysR family transcriptional regulator [Myxococcota bacterium]